MSEIMAIGGYIVAAMTLSLAYVLWRKSNNLHEVLVEAMSRNEALEIEASHHTAAIEDIKNRQIKKSTSTARLEKSLDNYKSKSEKMEQELSENRQTYELTLEKERTQIDRYSTEVRALTKQLVEIDHEKRTVRVNNENKHKEALVLVKQELDKLQEKHQKTAGQLKKFESSNKKLESILKKVDPKDTIRAKRKIKQYSQLFVIMKGQKEMAEELSSNWETALRQTSQWILQKSNPSESIPKKIGPLVGSALRVIGGQLVDDSATEPSKKTDSAHPESESDLDQLIAEAAKQPIPNQVEIPAAEA